MTNSSDFDFRFSDSPNNSNYDDNQSVSSLIASCSKESNEKSENEHCRKKRSKFSEDNEKKKKKTEDGEPRITRPCTECGKKFWSWKALFGHMRCHPERQWRGMNPPPNFRRDKAHADQPRGVYRTEEDHEVAACLLLLASGDANISVTAIDTHQHHLRQSDSFAGDATTTTTTSGEADGAASSDLNCRFECSSCNKVFGSHQALGGHRASHKNVKGCFANAITNTRSDSTTDQGLHVAEDHYQDQIQILTQNNNENNTVPSTSSGRDHDDHVQGGMFVLGSGSGHKCNICLRVFPSGQALGGHKRCHWEKGDNDPSISITPFPSSNSSQPCLAKAAIDLNLPAPLQLEHDDTSSPSACYSSPLTLDLRLGP